MRVFEIHETQVGVLVFVAETFSSAFVVSTPEDYRALHTSLLEDFYGELIYQYALLYDMTFMVDLSVDESKINSLADLRSAIAQMRSDWGAFQGFMASGLLENLLRSQIVYTFRQFQIQRLITNLNPQGENYIV